MDQLNRIESSEIDPHVHGQLIFDKVQRQFSGENNFVNKNVAETIDYSYAKKNFNPYFIPYTKINSKWIINLN